MPSQPIEPPGGRFAEPANSDSPLLAFRCGAAVKPYIVGDTNAELGTGFVSILVDTEVVFQHISGTSPITIPSPLNIPGNDLDVTITAATGNGGEIMLTEGRAPLNATETSISFSLLRLKPRVEPYKIKCSARWRSQRFTSQALLRYHAPPKSGSVTRMDMRAGGALLAHPVGKAATTGLAPIFPFGFYTNFDGYLAKNLSVIAELKEQGFNMIHPVPSFGDLGVLDKVLDEMERVGLYLMYDMRGTYKNLTSVAEQVSHIQSRQNLLLWYTADEPDGWGDPLSLTLDAYNTILSIDKGYHPTSLVLNCQNYHFSTYSLGADILMQDAYVIGNNKTFSTEWGTVCTDDYGDCGCDNCKDGRGFRDIALRMDEFAERIRVNSWQYERPSVWAVPQAFGDQSYWKREPTGKEFVVQAIVAINHGALGIVPWLDPTSAEIKASASSLALSLPRISPFVLNGEYQRRQITLGELDIAIWTRKDRKGQGLVLLTNMVDQEAVVDLTVLGVRTRLKDALQPSLQQDATVAGAKVTIAGLGSAGYVF